MPDPSTARIQPDERPARLARAVEALHRFAAVTRPVEAHSRPREAGLLSGWPALDARLGGLSAGESLAVHAAEGAGGLALVGDWLRHTARDRHRAVLVDADGSVGPEVALEVPVVRTPHGWVATDLLLRSGGFDLVALVGSPRADRGRVGPRVLRLLAEHGSRLLLLPSRGASPPFRPDHSVSVTLTAVEWSSCPIGDAPARRTFRVEAAGAFFEVTRDDCTIDRLRPDSLAPDRSTPRGRKRKR